MSFRLNSIGRQVGVPGILKVEREPFFLFFHPLMCATDNQNGTKNEDLVEVVETDVLGSSTLGPPSSDDGEETVTTVDVVSSNPPPSAPFLPPVAEIVVRIVLIAAAALIAYNLPPDDR